jgi:limonene-1,2-epoxide hydrolase
MVTSSSAADVVGAFLAAFDARDLDRALSYVTDDVEYDNVPVGAVHGPDGMRSVLTPLFERTTQMECVVHHQAAEGDVVMNDRTDRLEFGDRSVEARIAAVFVVRDGKIALWREYFDLGEAQKIREAMEG